MLSRRTICGPATAFFHTAVRTVLPCQVTSRGIPTLTDSRPPTGPPEFTTRSPSHADDLLLWAVLLQSVTRPRAVMGANAAEHRRGPGRLGGPGGRARQRRWLVAR